MNNINLFYYIGNNKSLSHLVQNDIISLLSYNPQHTNVYCLEDKNENSIFYSYDCSIKKWNKKYVNSSLFSFIEYYLLGSKKSLLNIFMYAGHANSYYIHPSDDIFMPLTILSNKLYSFDLIIFDACAMASLECLYQFRKSCKYMIACEGYAGDKGFMTKNTLYYIDQMIPLNMIDMCIKIIQDAYLYQLEDNENNENNEPWNAVLLSTSHIKEMVDFLNLSEPHYPEFQNLPFIYDNFHFTDLYTFFMSYLSSISLKNTFFSLFENIVLYFIQNDKDKQYNSKGLSFLPIIKGLDNSKDLYQKLDLYNDCIWIRNIHNKYKYDVRLCCINLQYCNTADDMKKWHQTLMETEAEIFFIQEISKNALKEWINIDPSIHIIQWDKQKNTAVIICSTFPYEKILSLHSIHLDDIPAPIHALYKIPYEGNPENIKNISQLIDICIDKRYNDMLLTMQQISNDKISIVAGDFNEPSHLDLYGKYKINWPISTMMQKNGFIDIYFEKHNQNNILSSYTWPCYPYYKNDPKQRIDFIYIRGLDIKNIIYVNKYKTFKKWLSDHYALICDIKLY